MIKSIIDIPRHFRGYFVMVLFTITCLSIYEWGLFRKEKLRLYLEKRIETLNIEKQAEKAAYITLTEQITAQDDPEWIELLMKKNLGLTRADETKIVFRTKD